MGHEELIPGNLRALARLLSVIEDFSQSHGRDPYTRELLGILRSWGYGESILLLAWDLGLVERYDDYCDEQSKRVCRFNRLSKRGREFLRHYNELLKLLSQ
ncbi:MAG: hypothetical protein L7G99_06165 [Vulcanisaeta sp.]|jgi:hypothetical protein|nr:hypothetical protein [Vulcanisaeta sp.]